MAQINGYKYPELSPSEAEEIIDILVNGYGGEVTSEEAFAQEIGHSTSNSGAYRGKLADLRKYGLLESRGIDPTSLAFDLANPKDAADEYQTKFEMMENVSLLSELYEDLGGREPPNELWRVIEEITGANPKDARDAAEAIEELYDSMLSFAKKREREPSGRTVVPTESTVEEPQKTQAVPKKDSGILVRVGNDEMSFENVSDGNLELARLFLKNRMGQDGNDESPKEENDSQQRLPTE